MHKLSDSPIVTFSRGGETFELGQRGGGPVLHLYGSTGLGLAPMSIASAPRLTGDGNVVRGVRYESRDVYIPLRLDGGTTGELSTLRRRLTALLAPHLGPVELRIQDPATETDRMIRGFYKDGLTGDFGAGFYGSWQTLGLTFECPDPWWLGDEKTVSFFVNPGTKPFLSTVVPFFPVKLSASTVIGRFDVNIQGDGDVFPVWEIEGPGEDLKIADGANRLEINGQFKAGEVVRIDTREGRITPDRWADIPVSSRLFPLSPGQHNIRVTMVGATTETVVRLTYRERYLEGV